MRNRTIESVPRQAAYRKAGVSLFLSSTSDECRRLNRQGFITPTRLPVITSFAERP
jgi:hypothetical protein